MVHSLRRTYSHDLILALSLNIAYFKRAPHRRATAPSINKAKNRTKKGPRRVKKSAEQLDKEMEDYRAASYMFDLKPKMMSES